MRSSISIIFVSPFCDCIGYMAVAGYLCVRSAVSFCFLVAATAGRIDASTHIRVAAQKSWRMPIRLWGRKNKQKNIRKKFIDTWSGSISLDRHPQKSIYAHTRAVLIYSTRTYNKRYTIYPLPTCGNHWNNFRFKIWYANIFTPGVDNT
jgi:hypothetical protein